jgi:hypothetical protein
LDIVAPGTIVVAYLAFATSSILMLFEQAKSELKDELAKSTVSLYVLLLKKNDELSESQVLLIESVYLNVIQENAYRLE